jgi:hypothetical protein
MDAAAKRRSEEKAHKLAHDPIYWDLVKFSREHVGRATHDALLRFKWAEYSYEEGVAALSFILCSMLAVVNRELSITPDEFARMARDRLITIREEHQDEDDDNE